jgi:hypothetical protein
MPQVLGPTDERDAISLSLFTWKVTIATLAIITSIFCYLTVIDAQTARCAGQSWLLGQRSGTLDLLAPAILSVGGAIALAIRGTPEKIRQYLFLWSYEVFRLRSIRITYGTITVTLPLIAFLIFFGMLTWISAKRYNAIAYYCQATGVGLPTASSARPAN